MTIKLRNYNNVPGFSKDFHKVRDFVIRINKDKFVSINYLWERWEWSFCLKAIDTVDLSHMGIWEENGEIVAVAALEQSMGEVFPLVDSGFNFLKNDVLEYSLERLKKDNKLKILIQDDDCEFQICAIEKGLIPTQEKDPKSVIDIDLKKLAYKLPSGYSIRSLADEFDMYKYNQVLWKGFGHGENPPTDSKHMKGRRASLSGPHQDMDLCIAVAAPSGEFVSYCGMWYDSHTDYALVEPVATDPGYRKMGLGKAAVLEGVKRCGLRGAKRAYVGSSQQFYYKIGFRPAPGGTFWSV